MCTVSWLTDAATLALVFNRDEKKTRGPAAPPTPRVMDTGVAYLAPTDSDAGGSWIMANAYGVVAALLNYYPADASPAPRTRSRGEIVLRLAEAAAFNEAHDLLTSMTLTGYSGFELLLVAPGEAAAAFRWDTHALSPVPADTMLTSSSYRTEEVCGWRRELYDRSAPGDINGLLAFQSSHEGPSSAYAPCMHRSDAHTVSQCVIQVDATRVSMRYANGSPCAAPLDVPLLLARDTTEPDA